MNRKAVRVVLFVIVCLALKHSDARAETSYTLKNDLRVRLVPSKGDKEAVVLLGVRAGFMEEPVRRPHLAHVTEHLTVFDLPAEESNAVAAWFKTNRANGETLGDFMYFDLRVRPAEVGMALRVQAARLGALDFSQETLVREIPRTLAEIDFVERSAFPAAGKFALAPFVQAALHGKTDVPIRAQTPKITVGDVRTFHERTFRPDRAMIVVVGEFDEADVRRGIEAHFGGLSNPVQAQRSRPRLMPGEHAAVWVVSTRHLFLAWPAPPADHADHAALTIAALSLIERFAANAGIAGLGNATPILNDVEGVFLVSFQAKPQADLAQVKSRVVEEVSALSKASAWKAGDVDRLKRTIVQSFFTDVDLKTVPLPPRITKTMAQANIELQRMGKALVWGDLQAYRKQLNQVAADMVAGAVEKYLNPAGACIVRVEPAMQKER